MKYAIIENGTVTNIVEAEAEFATAQGWVEAESDSQIGGTYNGSSFTRMTVTDIRTDAEKKEAARKNRDGRLSFCDWTIMPDSPLSDSDKAAWQTYRQALRDVPEQENFPDNIAWPSMPV